MKLSWKSIPLHNKILGALVLGAIFGAIFNVSKYELTVNMKGDRGSIVSETVKGWQQIEFVGKDSAFLASFGPEDQLSILRFSRTLGKEDRSAATMRVRGDERESGSTSEWRELTGIVSVEKVKSLAVVIKPVGNIFIRLLMFISIPLVLASLIVGAASLGDIRRVGKLGGKTIGWYLITITVSITIGLTLVNLIQPGKQLAPEAQEKLLAEFQTDIKAEVPPVDLVGMLVNIVATNPIKALADGEMLQIVFFALMIGVSLTLVPASKSKPVIDFFDGLSDTMIKMVGMIMNVAPYGVFALIAATVGEFGFDILETLFWYALTLLIGLSIQTFGFLGIAVRIFSGIPYRKFFSGMKDAMLVAFTTSSSGATLPVNMRCCEDNLGVPKNITSFVLPLGATVNMDGTSMYQAVASVFIAQVYGFDLNLAEQLTILFTAILASIGTAPVPGVGIIMLIIVLRSVNVPEEGIALILGIDRFLDMCRTVPNIVGDAAVSAVIAKQEGLLEERP